MEYAQPYFSHCRVDRVENYDCGGGIDQNVVHKRYELSVCCMLCSTTLVVNERCLEFRYSRLEKAHENSRTPDCWKARTVDLRT